MSLSCITDAYKLATFRKYEKEQKLVPIVKHNKENSVEISQFRAINLLNVVINVFEKVLINRILHYIYTNSQLNQNQYGFTLQKNTTDSTVLLNE